MTKTYKTRNGQQTGFVPGAGVIVDGKITVPDDVVLEGNFEEVKQTDQTDQAAPVAPAATPTQPPVPTPPPQPPTPPQPPVNPPQAQQTNNGETN